MKNTMCILFVLFSFTAFSQSHENDSLRLSVSPVVNKEDTLNRQIITTLALFLKTKDSSFTSSPYWSKKDFEKYILPYEELEGIENGRLGRYAYQPSLMEIVPTDEETVKIAKVAFIGHNSETHDNIVKAIYNVVVTRQNDSIVLSKYLDYITRHWKAVRNESITYRISPSKEFNVAEAAQQRKEITGLCHFLKTTPLAITYYSCLSPEEVFQLKGFDYNHTMYIDTSGGFNQDVNIVISGNHSEYYTHEITHLYMEHLFPAINPFFNEGFATYTGGSGKYGYAWQRNQLVKFFAHNPGFSPADHVEDPFELLYYERETPVPYVLGALVCERTLRLYGKEKLFSVFKSDKPVWDTLRTVGLTKENMNAELHKEIAKSPAYYCCGTQKLTGQERKKEERKTLL